MPSDFDEFAAIADRDYSDVSEQAKANAQLLETVMQKHGFNGYWNEWWHYSDTVSYEAEDLQKADHASTAATDWFGMIGSDLSVVVNSVGTNYVSTYEAGGTCIYYAEHPAQFFYNASNNVVYSIAYSGSKEVGNGLSGKMRYPDVVNAVASYGVTLPEPEYYYNELDGYPEYMLQFDLNGIHVVFSWLDDPYTVESSYISFFNMDLLQ